MGYIAHRAIIATHYKSYSDDEYSKKHNQWLDDFESLRTALGKEGESFDRLLVGPIISVTNAYVSFALMPDGSKEGWDTSDHGDEVRERFIAICREHKIDFVEVRYGGDEDELARIESHGGD